MERFPTLTTCPCCEHDSDRVSLSAAGFTECPSCEYVHKLTPETLEELARVALLNLPGARALALLAEARDVLGMAAPVEGAPGPSCLAVRARRNCLCAHCVRAERAARGER